MNVVIDTNIFISGIFFGGSPYQILNLVEEKIITPCFYISTIQELQEVLYFEKFDKVREFSNFSVKNFLRRLKETSLIFPQPQKIHILIKENLVDNYILACALSCQASFIVSGDKHLLKLKEFKGIPILQPKEFLKIRTMPR